MSSRKFNEVVGCLWIQALADEDRMLLMQRTDSVINIIVVDNQDYIIIYRVGIELKTRCSYNSTSAEQIKGISPRDNLGEITGGGGGRENKIVG